MATIPTLLQLCAEEVAKQTKRNRKLRKHLKHVQFPEINISYVKERLFKTCDFLKFIRREMGSSRILLSKPKMRDNHEFKITVTGKQVLYIATLDDLGRDMLKLDCPMGDYVLAPFHGGYILKTKEYEPKFKDIIHVFGAQNDEKGLRGTCAYHVIDDDNILRIFNQYISEQMRDVEWWSENMHVPSRRVLKVIKQIPVLFYLTEKIELHDLPKVKLTCVSEINNCGNVEACWYVEHSEKGAIGIAVKQSKLYKMISELPGVGLLAACGFRAIGNFNTEFVRGLTDTVCRMIFRKNHFYRCEFRLCNCDFSYSYSLNSYNRKLNNLNEVSEFRMLRICLEEYSQ